MKNRATLLFLFFVFLFLTIQIHGVHATVVGMGAVVFSEAQVYGTSQGATGAAQPPGAASSPTGTETAVPGGEAGTAQPKEVQAQPPSEELPQSGDMSPESQSTVTTDPPSEAANETGQPGTPPPPSETPAPDITQDRTPVIPAVPQPGKDVPVAGAPEEKKFVVLRSVLQAFRDYTGEKNPQSLTALFESVSIPDVRQEPSVVLSDGKTPAKLIIQVPTTVKAVRSFYLKGAKLVSLKMEGAAWVVEVLPDSQVYEASVTVLSNGSTTEIPITVATPMDADIGPAIAPGEKEFNMFLKERGTDKAPIFDLNNDGKRDYIDEYIYTANFIVKRNILPETKTKYNK